MSGVKKLVVREGLILNNLSALSVGSPLLSINPSTNEVGTTPAIDTSTFITRSLQDTYVLIGDSTNLAQPRQISGAISITRLGVVSITPNSITDDLISPAASIQYSKLNLTNSITNNDISGSAAISKTKIANGTPNRLLINNASGVFSEASAITGSRLLGSDINGIPIALGPTVTEAGFISGVLAPIQTQLNDRLSFSSAITPTEGDLVYYTGGAWNRLPRGTSGQYLAATPSTIQWVTVPNGLPTGGTANQYLTKIDGTDFNTQWSTLTLSKVSDVTATVAQVNVLATGYYDATSSIQTQLGQKLGTGLAQNALFVGNASNVASQLSPGTNGQVLQIVAGSPQWQTIAGTGSVTSIDVAGGTTGLTTTGGPVTTTGIITLTGTVNPTHGGTGLTTYTTGDILYASASNVLSKLPVSTNGFILTLAAGVPVWAANSGGGISGLTTNRIPYATSSTTLGDDSFFTWDPTNKALTVTFLRIHTRGSNSNVFIGNGVGNFTLTGANNNAIGISSLISATTAAKNTCLGSLTGTTITTGSDNTLLGYTAGQNITTGSNNIVLGSQINAQSATTSNQLSIQNIIFGLGNSATGTSVSTGTIGIGVAAPTATLHLAAGTTAKASLRIDAGSAPTAPNDGDIWYDGTNLFMRIGGVTKTFTIV